jgi:hypothetical protein
MFFKKNTNYLLVSKIFIKKNHMYSRKTENYKNLNLVSEERYIKNKFLKEDNDTTNGFIKLQVTSIPKLIGKYKISYFQKQPNGNLKDILTDEILKKLGLMVQYASQESAELAIKNINQSEIKKELGEK